MEVETVINRIEGVVESCVVGVADEKWGERVVAAVVSDRESNLIESQIIAFCKEHLHSWKCPKQILVVNQIPRNTMGKMLKEEVKKIFE